MDSLSSDSSPLLWINLLMALRENSFINKYPSQDARWRMMNISKITVIWGKSSKGQTTKAICVHNSRPHPLNQAPWTKWICHCQWLLGTQVERHINGLNLCFKDVEMVAAHQTALKLLLHFSHQFSHSQMPTIVPWIRAALLELCK